MHVCTPVKKFFGLILGATQTAKEKTSFEIYTTVEDMQTGQRKAVRALLDTGATGNFIDEDYARERGLKLHRLPYPIPVRNADGTENAGGKITWEVQVRLDVKDHSERIWMQCVSLGKGHRVLLGLPWLNNHNPEIDWPSQKIEFTKCRTCHVRKTEADAPPPVPEKPKPSHRTIVEEVKDEGEDYEMSSTEYIWSMNKDDTSNTGASVEDDIRKFVPPHYQEFADVFRKTSFDQLPEHDAHYDHAINTKGDFVLK